MAQPSFYYYNPEQHGHFSQQPGTIPSGNQLQHFQQQMYSPEMMMQSHLHMQQRGPSVDSQMYMQPPSYQIQAAMTPMASPRPLFQKPLFLFQGDSRSLSLDTECGINDGYMYPSTPPLSISGSAISSPPMSCGILPTPIHSTFFNTENIEGVKEGCEGDVKSEILAGGDWTRCGSPPLTPGEFACDLLWSDITCDEHRVSPNHLTLSSNFCWDLVFIHPPSVTASQASDLLSTTSCPSLSPSPSPIPQSVTSDADFDFCDPRNLLVKSPISSSKVLQFDLSPLPTSYADGDGHKLLPGFESNFIKPELQFSNGFDTLGSTLGGLPSFDTFSDLDSDNEFVTDLARYPSDTPLYLGNKRQRLDLLSFSDEDFLSEDSFEDFEEVDQFAAAGLPSPLEFIAPQHPSSDMSTKTKSKKRAPLRKAPRKVRSDSSELSELDSLSSSQEQSFADNTTSQQSSTHQQESNSTDNHSGSADGNAVTSGSDGAPSTPQPVARRGRKQSLTEDPSKTFVCTLCSRRFRRQEHLKRHYRSLHTHEKPFECNECGKTFSRSDNLAQHARTHGSGAIVMGVLEDGELPPLERGEVFGDENAGVLGEVLFQAAQAAAADASSSSSDSGNSVRSMSPAPSIENAKLAKKRKREE
ncbi:hypothetical protein MMC15_004531 [Xylographa vitiligo]|nr:hypothetical protein [Xylographa vitiligo]